MVLINPKQVEWLYKYRPNTFHTVNDQKGIILHPVIHDFDVDHARRRPDICKYYLTPETYNSLPTEFKQLAD
jgi:hypothetical protein